MKDKTLMTIMSVTLLLTVFALGMLNSKVTLMHNEFHASISVTPAQLDSALVEASYLLLSERDSSIRECAKRLGPLDPECRP